MTTRRSADRLFAVLVTAAWASLGCGYKLVDYNAPPGDLRSISIITLENESYEPGIEFVMADNLRREFLRRGALDVLEDPSEADMVLSGRIAGIATLSRSFSSVELALESEVVMELALVATRRDGRSIQLEGNLLKESERYLHSADHQATRKNRHEALQRIASVLAGRVHDLLYEVALQ